MHLLLPPFFPWFNPSLKTGQPARESDLSSHRQKKGEVKLPFLFHVDSEEVYVLSHFRR